MTPLSIFIRCAVGLGIVAAAVAAGYQHRSLWMIPLLGTSFGLIDILSKWRRWRGMWSDRGPAKTLVMIPVTILTQWVLVGLLFLVGFGLGAMIEPGRPFLAPSAADVYFALITFVLATSFGLFANFLERDSDLGALDLEPDEFVAQMLREMEAEAFDLRHEPVTAKTFFEQDDGVGADEVSFHAARRRMGFDLPASLSALFRHQDGGATGALYVPVTDDPSDDVADWVVAVPDEYIYPLDDIEIREVQDGSINVIHAVLADDYESATVLVYDPETEQSRVALLTEDDDERLVEMLSFASFDAFLRAIRRSGDRDES